MKIGIMDSGIGGLTVLKEALRQLPNHEYLYYADSKNAPYGTKTQEEVYERTKEAVTFLVAQGAQLVVIACNTATSAAAHRLRAHMDCPIIGMEPAIKPALQIAQDKRVLVAATKLTLSSEKFKQLVAETDVKSQIDPCPLSELVQFAEAGDFTEATILPYLKAQLAPFQLDQYASVVFGCTHFPLFKNHFEKLFSKDVVMLDGSVGTVNRMKSFVLDDSIAPTTKLFLSGHLLEQGETFDLIWSIINR